MNKREREKTKRVSKDKINRFDKTAYNIWNQCFSFCILNDSTRSICERYLTVSSLDGNIVQDLSIGEITLTFSATFIKYVLIGSLELYGRSSLFVQLRYVEEMLFVDVTMNAAQKEQWMCVLLVVCLQPATDTAQF